MDNKEILETLWCWDREVQVNLKDDLFASQWYGWTNCLGQSSMYGQYGDIRDDVALG